MKFEWVDTEKELLGLRMRSGLFSCSVIKWKDKYNASIEIGSGAGFLGIGGITVGSADFDDEETAKTACENTIIQYCKAIVETAEMEQK